MSDFAPCMEEKVWGQVLHLFTSKHSSISLLEVDKDSWCSIHKHKDRVNHFIVIEGLIEILGFGESDEPSTHPLESTLLGPGNSLTVPAKVWHQFVVKESGRMIEVYWPSEPGKRVWSTDIERRTLGGKIDA